MPRIHAIARLVRRLSKDAPCCKWLAIYATTNTSRNLCHLTIKVRFAPPPSYLNLQLTVNRIPLNDDKHEKAVRFQSRQALYDLQINNLRAAAVSPMRRVSGHDGARGSHGSPHTPQGTISHEVGLNGDIMAAAAGKSMTPLQRVPILANYEAWIKMATDNKINAANSWNFALIDYFHDMSLLKEGDSVNFQKASCTLDGCVKIYTSRVDSVATETGKLLSGLADGQSKRNASRADDSQGQEGEDGEDSENEDGTKKRTKKKATRSSEATLANGFSSLQLKKFELEFSVDPLFKKASADFDEGGAKGLLLNHLAIDAQGRIVFDSSDDVDKQNDQEEVGAEEGQETDLLNQESLDQSDIHADTETDTRPDIDLNSLRTKFFADLNILDSQDICPSLKNFDLGDPASALDIPFLKDAATAGENSPGTIEDGHDPIQFDNGAADDDDGNMGGFDVLVEVPFGQGGEVWAQEAALESQRRTHTNDYHGDEDGGGTEPNEVTTFDADSSQYGVGLIHGKGALQHDNILSYFDNTMAKNWAGPEHWKIRRVKDSDKQSTIAPKRKEKEAFEIDFSSPLDSMLADVIYTTATSTSTITLPKAQQKSKTRNLLPDDKHFNSRQLLSLFLKPKARLGSRRKLSRPSVPKPNATREIDEAYWATQDATANQDDNAEPGTRGDYDANFFQDDGALFPTGLPEDDDDDFADARDRFSPIPEGNIGEANPSIDGITNNNNTTTNAQSAAFGSQLVTQSNRLRPEYVQYARVAKKVDIRRLKDEIWKGMGYTDVSNLSIYLSIDQG